MSRLTAGQLLFNRRTSLSLPRSLVPPRSLKLANLERTLCPGIRGDLLGRVAKESAFNNLDLCLSPAVGMEIFAVVLVVVGYRSEFAGRAGKARRRRSEPTPSSLSLAES